MDVGTGEPVDGNRDRREKDVEAEVDAHADGDASPPPQTRRNRDSRERRDDRDLDLPPNRRNRSPPPPQVATGLSRVDRDSKDFRRRNSPSPPPPPFSHRGDMRRSPPRMSSPSFGPKRSRRDDGGYDRRRRSPRGGFGSDDRRLDYDYDTGSRPHYGDDRIPRRRGPEWSDPGRGAYSDGSSAKREGLMSYKQFIQELEDDILPAEAERRYKEYRSEYISTQKRVFFESHKEEEWLKNKYHPTNLLSVIERRNVHAKEAAKAFLLELQNGTLDIGPGLSAPLNKPGQGSLPNSDDETNAVDKRRKNSRGTLKGNELSAAPKAHPVSSETRRIQIDIERTLALVRKVDSEKGIEENILSAKLDGDKTQDASIGPIVIIRGLTTVRGLEGVELLDTLITYLWRIHGVDYYGMAEKHDPKGLRHVRAADKSFEEMDKAPLDWEKNLDSFWQDRLHSQDPLELMASKEKIETASVDILDPSVRKIRDEKYGWKYGCGAKGCTKLFHAAEFVYKHLRLKHPEIVLELTSKLRDDFYFQNYMDDADAPGGTPVMQQSTLREKIPRRRPIADRLRDTRGSRRGHDDRYDRSEKSPPHDHEMNGVPDSEKPDEPMFDAYDAEGVVGASFPSDMAHPPVLMPVPGAGPLGPFVPAPPEFAMQMLRDQGGSPFEGNGGTRGRKGRLGPSLGASGPILSLPTAFPRDPRHIRSYQDLDAPEDEVTVIDYRSL